MWWPCCPWTTLVAVSSFIIMVVIIRWMDIINHSPMKSKRFKHQITNYYHFIYLIFALSYFISILSSVRYSFKCVSLHSKMKNEQNVMKCEDSFRFFSFSSLCHIQFYYKRRCESKTSIRHIRNRNSNSNWPGSMKLNCSSWMLESNHLRKKVFNIKCSVFDLT